MQALVKLPVMRGKFPFRRTWIEPGMYPVLRQFDKNRVVIDIGDGSTLNTPTHYKQVTLVDLKDVTIV